MFLLYCIVLKMGISWQDILGIDEKKNKFLAGEINFYPEEEGGYWRNAQCLGQSGLLLSSKTYKPRFYFFSELEAANENSFECPLPKALGVPREKIEGISFFPIPSPSSDFDQVISKKEDCKESAYLLKKSESGYQIFSFSAKENPAGMQVFLEPVMKQYLPLGSTRESILRSVGGNSSILDSEGFRHFYALMNRVGGYFVLYL